MMLETAQEPPYGWWPDTPPEDRQQASERIVPPVVTEYDIADPLTVWVDCELGETVCTGGDYAAEMVQDGRGWICPACNAEMIREWDIQQASITRLYEGR